MRMNLKVDLNKSRKQRKNNDNPKNTELNFLFVTGNNILTQLFNYTLDLKVVGLNNVSTYDVYINNQFYGSDITSIQINTNDVLRFEIVKTNPSLEVTKEDINKDSTINFFNTLI